MTNNTKTKLYIATQDYPYGSTAERVFVESELKYLNEVFDVTIFSHARQKNKAVCVNVPEGVKVIDIPANMDITFKDKLRYGIRFLFDKDTKREISLIKASKASFFKRLYESAGFYILAMKDYECIKPYIENAEGIYYSFWYFYFCYSMTKHRGEYPKLKIVTRTHGHELYEERYIGGRQPYKPIMDDGLDRIIFAAAYAKDYYISHYEKDPSDNKYALSRLGVLRKEAKPSVEDRHENALREEALQEADGYDFLLVSCSSLLPLKRVDLIIAALSHIQGVRIKWVHFGDGPMMEDLKKQAELFLKSNIEYQFMGNVDNHLIHEYYIENKPDCFITTSSTEGGCPVSIQEAYAYRIPVIGCANGGITEMIDNNGILLSENPGADEIAQAIKKMADLSKEEREQMKEVSYQLYEKMFNAKTNAENMIDILKKL